MSIINSKCYWNERFQTGDWDKFDGDQQAEFFAQLAVTAFPTWFKQELIQNDWRFVDYGCAKGSGTAHIARLFPHCQFTGVDFSEEAIRKASESYPFCNFTVGNILNPTEKAEVIFSSNTLEHFANPMEIFEKLIACSSKYVALLLPFEDESGIAEHFSIFNADFFPTVIHTHHLSFFKIIDCRQIKNTLWKGKQILLIYVNDAWSAPWPAKSMIGEVIGSVNKYEELANQANAMKNTALQENESLKEELRLIQEKRQQLSEEKEKLRIQIKELRDEAFEGKQTTIDLYASEKDKVNAALQGIAQECAAVSGLRSVRAAHLLAKLRNQFFLGSFKEKRQFIRWLFTSRKKRIADTNPATNPMYRLIAPVHELLNQKASNTTVDALLAEHRAISILEKRISAYSGNTVILLPELVDWNIPLFQRPQQLAMAFAQLGVLFIFTTPNGLDGIIEPKEVQHNCVLINSSDVDCVAYLVSKYHKRVILDICSTDNRHFDGWINKWSGCDYSILYEYIDEISEHITGKVPQETYDRHAEFLKDENVFVVATAEKLYREVIAVRKSEINCLHSGNGVDCAHFQQPEDTTMISTEFKKIIDLNQPIIGYFGAIANWFDFELVMYAAQQRPNYQFLLIGPHYGNHDLSILNDVEKMPNIHLVGTISYNALPHVAQHFTVATIPFLINDITESTSPIKLYEYMALGKPIVTTAMPECYKHTVHIAESPEQYVELLDVGIHESKDPVVVEKLRNEAIDNSWSTKAKELIELMGITCHEA